MTPLGTAVAVLAPVEVERIWHGVGERPWTVWSLALKICKKGYCITVILMFLCICFLAVYIYICLYGLYIYTYVCVSFFVCIYTYIHMYIHRYILYTSIHIIGMYVYICIWVYLQEIWLGTSTCFIVPAVQDEDATCCLWGKGLETTPTTCFSRWNFRRLLKFQLVDEVVDELCWILHVITFVWKSFALIQCWLNWHVVVFKRNRVPDFTRLSFFPW